MVTVGRPCGQWATCGHLKLLVIRQDQYPRWPLSWPTESQQQRSQGTDSGSSAMYIYSATTFIPFLVAPARLPSAPRSRLSFFCNHFPPWVAVSPLPTAKARRRNNVGCVDCPPFHCAGQRLLGHEEIENQLKQDRAWSKNEVKMLLLGAGESGKVSQTPEQTSQMY